MKKEIFHADAYYICSCILSLILAIFLAFENTLHPNIQVKTPTLFIWDKLLCKDGLIPCSCVGLLQSQEANCVADRCKYKKALVLVYYKKKSLFILQVKLSYRDPERICGHRDRIACSGLGNGEIPPFLYASYFILETDQKMLEAMLSEFKPSNSKITVDTDQVNLVLQTSLQIVCHG